METLNQAVANVDGSKPVDLQCPHCNMPKREAEGKKGWTVIRQSSGHAMLSCTCGHSSKLFGDEIEALNWWNTRHGQLHAKLRRSVTAEHKPRADTSQVTPPEAPSEPDLSDV